MAVFGDLFSLVCGSGAEDASRTSSPPVEATLSFTAVPTPAPTSTAAPVVTPTARPRRVASETRSLDAAQRAGDLVVRAYRFDEQVRFFEIDTTAVQDLGELGHEGAVIPLIELIIFATQSTEVVAFDDALEKLTGERFGAGDWRSWYRWFGEHPEGEPLAGVGDWNADPYRNVDPRLEVFFRGDPDSSIPLWTAQWGVVVLDGIRP